MGDSSNSSCITEILFDEFEKIRESARDRESMFVEALPYVLIPVSLILLTMGHIVIRPSYALIGFCIGCFSSIQIFHYLDHMLPCNIEIGIMLAIGFSKAIASGFMIRASAVLLGMISGFVIVFAIFIAFPVLDAPIWPDIPVVAGYRLFPSWAVSTLCSLAFGIVCYKKYNEVSIIITSTMGGYALSLAVLLIKNTITDLVQMIIFISSTIFGVLFQFSLKRYLKKRKEKRKQKASKNKEDRELENLPRTSERI